MRPKKRDRSEFDYTAPLEAQPNAGQQELPRASDRRRELHQTERKRRHESIVRLRHPIESEDSGEARAIAESFASGRANKAYPGGSAQALLPA